MTRRRLQPCAGVEMFPNGDDPRRPGYAIHYGDRLVRITVHLAADRENQLLLLPIPKVYAPLPTPMLLDAIDILIEQAQEMRVEIAQQYRVQQLFREVESDKDGEVKPGGGN